MNHSLIGKLALVALSSSILAAQPAPHTVLDGIYTEAQAERGDAAYQAHCANCHGDTLYGRALGALRGDVFLDRWREQSVKALYDHIRTRMPANDPGTLSEGMYLDILAYILKVNAYPTGAKDMTPAALTDILMVGKDGPQPVATNTIVAVIGCMEKVGDLWIVNHATPPARESKPDEITADERKAAAARPLGALEFELRNLDEMPAGFLPESHAGQKIETKGVLVRNAKRDRIHVMSLETVESTCRP